MPRPQYVINTVAPVTAESWELAAAMIPVLEQFAELNKRLWKLQEHSANAKPVPMHPEDVAAAIRNLRK